MGDSLVGADQATEQDLPLLETLAVIARDEAHPTRGGRLLLEHDYDNAPASQRLADALHGAHAGLWCGTLDGVTVGYASASTVTKGAITVAMIDTLFVHPDARGIGVAAALLEQVREWALEAGAEALESQVLPGNRDAKNFFERTGMITRQMRVSMPLDG